MICFSKRFYSVTPRVLQCTLGGVGTFAKEKELELKWINSVKKQRRKEVTMSDRTLASAGPARPVSDSSWVRSRSSDQMLPSKGDRTSRVCVRSRVTY